MTLCGQVAIGGFLYNVKVDFKEADNITSKIVTLNDQQKKDLTDKVNAFAQELFTSINTNNPPGVRLDKNKLIQINETGVLRDGEMYRWEDSTSAGHSGLAAPHFQSVKNAWNQVFQTINELSNGTSSASGTSSTSDPSSCEVVFEVTPRRNLDGHTESVDVVASKVVQSLGDINSKSVKDLVNAVFTASIPETWNTDDNKPKIRAQAIKQIIDTREEAKRAEFKKEVATALVEVLKKLNRPEDIAIANNLFTALKNLGDDYWNDTLLHRANLAELISSTASASS
jgi:hypothetical protein